MSQRELSTLAREIVGECQPAELAYFDRLMAESLADDSFGLPSQSRKPLGFGVGELATVITPIVIAVITAITTNSVEELIKRARAGGRPRWLPRRKQPKVDMIPVVDAATAEKAGELAQTLALAIHVDAEAAVTLRITLTKRLGGIP